MAKSSVVQIHVFGRVETDEDAFFELALTAAAASSSAPWDTGYSSDDFFTELEKAETERRAVKFELHDDWDVFETLTTECQAAGLSYVAYIAEGGEEGWSSGISWRPGMREEFEFAVHGENAEPTIPVNALRAAQKQGQDAVLAILNTLETNTKIGIIEIDPAFAANHSKSANETAPTGSSPRP